MAAISVASAQINQVDVSALQVAWTYPIGDTGNYLFNPVVVVRQRLRLAREFLIVALDAVGFG